MSIKVIEGQISFWQMSSELSKVSNSFSSQMMRQFVSDVVSNQSVAPDVLPRTINVEPSIDETGRLMAFRA